MFKDCPRSMDKSQSHDSSQGCECQHPCPGTAQMGVGWGERRQGSTSDKLGVGSGLQDVPGEVLRALGVGGGREGAEGGEREALRLWP